SDSAHVFYKCSDYYDPHDQGGILWSDPTIAIEWPLSDPIISDKDALLPIFSDIPAKKLYDPLKAP
ncbi:MAG: dTDP-4-dehydrorhamnose 3,5-epimerase family protein, partial [Desulfobacterales bacterium]|nr:dTDP-4-dehydrorhamnose 3,5-epimerase family protein [Desulfobacterales bacterium]